MNSSNRWTVRFNLSPLVNHRFSIMGGVESLYTVRVSFSVLLKMSFATTVITALSPSVQSIVNISDSVDISCTDVNGLESFTPEPSYTKKSTRKSIQPTKRQSTTDQYLEILNACIAFMQYGVQH